MFFKFLLILILISLPFLSFAADADKANPNLQKDEERLKLYKEKIDAQQNKVQAIKSKEKSIFDDMMRIQQLIDQKEKELKALDIREESLENEIKSLESQAKDMEAKVAIQKEQLQKRSVAMYKFSDNLQLLKILFSTGSYIETFNRYKYLKLILNQDSKLIKDYKNSKLELVQKTEIIKKEKEKLDEIIKKVENKGKEILAKKNSKELLLLKIRKEKSYHLRVIREFSEATKKLENLISKIQRTDTKSKGNYKEKFEEFKGILELPVNGKVISLYGNEKVSPFNTYLFNNGIKIKTEIGEEVSSVFGGEVVYSDWFRGYGKLIIVSHGKGYYTVYSHLSKLFKKVGDTVPRGGIIAKSGDTGSITGPCLYFEVRINGQSVDPMEWLEPE